MPKFLHLKCLVCLALWVFKFYGFWSHFNFFVFINFYWTIVALQCCVGFCSTARWISHRYACIPSLLDFCPIRVTTAHRAELPVQHSRFSFSCLLLFEEQVLSNPLEGLCRSSLTRGPSCSEWWGARYSLGDPQGPTTLPLSCGRIFSGKTPRPLNCHILSDTALGQLVSWHFWQVPGAERPCPHSAELRDNGRAEESEVVEKPLMFTMTLFPAQMHSLYSLSLSFPFWKWTLAWLPLARLPSASVLTNVHWVPCPKCGPTCWAPQQPKKTGSLWPLAQ